jgi:signal peptidase I
MLVVMAPVRSAVVDWNWVPTGSMKPTILEGDLVWVDKLAYGLRVPFTSMTLASWGGPKAGDVAVFFSPANGERLVKRVVGVPGDTVELRRDVLFVNGRRLDYALRDAAPFRRDITEDPRPILASEGLGVGRHYVLILPGRPAMRSFGPVRVPEGAYFMMGDSRDNSLDSRYFGAVPADRIVGEAKGVLVSFDRSHWLEPRFQRFARPLYTEEDRGTR